MATGRDTYYSDFINICVNSNQLSDIQLWKCGPVESRKQTRQARYSDRDDVLIFYAVRELKRQGYKPTGVELWKQMVDQRRLANYPTLVNHK